MYHPFNQSFQALKKAQLVRTIAEIYERGVTKEEKQRGEEIFTYSTERKHFSNIYVWRVFDMSMSESRADVVQKIFYLYAGDQ